MITIMIVGEKQKENEQIGASIIGGIEQASCLLTFHDAEEAAAFAKEQKPQVDIFILHVKMEKKSGYRLAERLRQIPQYRDTPILFVTPKDCNRVGLREFATYRNFGRHNYIAAPVARLDIQGKIGLYLEQILENHASAAEARPVIYLEYDKGITFVPADEILYAEVQRGIVTLRTKRRTYTIKHTTLGKFIQQIDLPGFIQCHKSFALHAGNVESLQRTGKRCWDAWFAGGAACPVSITYYPVVEKQYREMKTLHLRR